MWLELAGGAAAWLTHTLWYLTSSSRHRDLPFNAWLRRQYSARLLRLASLCFGVVALALWIQAHGPSLGTCCAVAAWTAAASVNTLVTPLASRSLLALAGFATAAFGVGVAEWLRGA